MNANLEYQALSGLEKSAIYYDERRDKMLHDTKKSGFTKDEVKEFLELAR